MTDKKLTDSEIVNALSKVRYGGHGCKNCKYDNGKGDDRCGLKGCKIARYALDLITRQQAEIERLTKSLELVKGAKCVYSYDGETLEYCVHSPCPICKTADQIKSEAYKEFAERLKYVWWENGYESPDVDFDDFIDNLLKETCQ